MFFVFIHAHATDIGHIVELHPSFVEYRNRKRHFTRIEIDLVGNIFFRKTVYALYSKSIVSPSEKKNAYQVF